MLLVPLIGPHSGLERHLFFRVAYYPPCRARKSTSGGCEIDADAAGATAILAAFIVRRSLSLLQPTGNPAPPCGVYKKLGHPEILLSVAVVAGGSINSPWCYLSAAIKF